VDSHLAVVGIDISIGLPDTGQRQGDVLAYKLLGPRRSSVFMTPVRAALQAGSDAAAIEETSSGPARVSPLRCTGYTRRSSRSTSGPDMPGGGSWRCTQRCRLRRWPARRCLRQANVGRSAPSPALARRRWRRPADDVGEAGRHAAVDDVLDAGAAAWTASRVATGAATPLPDPPVEYLDGWPAAIWI
jgi:hypothetical protein